MSDLRHYPVHTFTNGQSTAIISQTVWPYLQLPIRQFERRDPIVVLHIHQIKDRFDAGILQTLDPFAVHMWHLQVATPTPSTSTPNQFTSIDTSPAPHFGNQPLVQV